MKAVAEWTRSERLFPATADLRDAPTNRYPIEDPVVEIQFKNGTSKARKLPVRSGKVKIEADRGPGIYVVRGATFEEQIAVNFQDPSESDLTVREKTDLSSFTEPLWWWNVPGTAIAAAIALLLCLLEWSISRSRT
jgi:hypothetical protein